jgi:hypothetical protein
MTPAVTADNYAVGMEQRTAKIIPFPGPKRKTLLDLAEPPASNIGRPPAQIRQLNDREVDHRRRMLLHLAKTGH